MFHFNRIIFAMVFSVVAVNTFAHDPSLHKKEGAEKPNCAAIEDMGQSKKDMNDPVMQAMLKQCMDGQHGSDHPGDKNKEIHHGDKKENEHKDGHHG